MVQTEKYKQKVREAVLEARENYSGTDAAFATTIGINNSIFSRLKKGETDRILSEGQWITIGRILGVSLKENNWKIVRTTIYDSMEKTLHFCQKNQVSMILVDEPEIGKTETAKHILRNMKNGFYVDCSQAKTKQLLIRTIAKTVGVDQYGRYADVIANLKYYLNVLETPIITLDEFGDLEYNAFLTIKELQNATVDHCAWLMIGSDGLRAKINQGIKNQKVGYREVFSRLSGEFLSFVPSGTKEKQQFYSELIGDVATNNVADKAKVNKLINKCLSKGLALRYLKTLIKASAE